MRIWPWSLMDVCNCNSCYSHFNKLVSISVSAGWAGLSYCDDSSSVVCLFTFSYKQLLLHNPFPHMTILQQATLNILCKSGKHCGKRRNCNFFFCHYVFKKPSAAEASESVYMRERANHLSNFHRDVPWVVPFQNCSKKLITCRTLKNIAFPKEKL